MSEWISVNDRLPEERLPVLISNGIDIGHAKRKVQFWIVIASNDVVHDEEVTHWMPLPEPPQ